MTYVLKQRWSDTLGMLVRDVEDWWWCQFIKNSSLATFNKVFLLECYDGILPLDKDWCENSVILLTSTRTFGKHLCTA